MELWKAGRCERCCIGGMKGRKVGIGGGRYGGGAGSKVGGGGWAGGNFPN